MENRIEELQDQLGDILVSSITNYPGYSRERLFTRQSLSDRPLPRARYSQFNPYNSDSLLDIIRVAVSD